MRDMTKGEMGLETLEIEPGLHSRSTFARKWTLYIYVDVHLCRIVLLHIFTMMHICAFAHLTFAQDEHFHADAHLLGGGKLLDSHFHPLCFTISQFSKKCSISRIMIRTKSCSDICFKIHGGCTFKSNCISLQITLIHSKYISNSSQIHFKYISNTFQMLFKCI